MNKPPAFSFYAQDFLTGVMYLTNEEKGIYITMLAKQWTDGKIPKKRLGFLVGFEWDDLSDELRSKFGDCGDYVVNPRLEKERDKKDKFIEKQRVNGQKGGRPKKPKGNPRDNPKESQKKPLEIEIENSFNNKVYEKFDFFKDWNELRTENLKKPSNIKHIPRDQMDLFNELKESYTREEFRTALIGLFKQETTPNGNTVMQGSTRHFLNHFNQYLTAGGDKNKSMYGKKDQNSYKTI